jgi:hypothetical protein
MSSSGAFKSTIGSLPEFRNNYAKAHNLDPNKLDEVTEDIIFDEYLIANAKETAPKMGGATIENSDKPLDLIVLDKRGKIKEVIQRRPQGPSQTFAPNKMTTSLRRPLMETEPKEPARIVVGNGKAVYVDRNSAGVMSKKDITVPLTTLPPAQQLKGNFGALQQKKPGLIDSNTYWNGVVTLQPIDLRGVTQWGVYTPREGLVTQVDPVTFNRALKNSVLAKVAANKKSICNLNFWEGMTNDEFNHSLLVAKMDAAAYNSACGGKKPIKASTKEVVVACLPGRGKPTIRTIRDGPRLVQVLENAEATCFVMPTNGMVREHAPENSASFKVGQARVRTVKHFPTNEPKSVPLREVKGNVQNRNDIYKVAGKNVTIDLPRIDIG